MPVCNLIEALNEVAARPHETHEQCLMSINRIGRATPGSRAVDLIAKLAEKAHFMRVNDQWNLVQDQEANSCSHTLVQPVNPGPNHIRPVNQPTPNHSRATG